MTCYIEDINFLNYCSSLCPLCDGLVYPSLPEKIKCSITNEFHVVGDKCNCVEERNRLNMGNNMENSMNQIPVEAGESIVVKPTPTEKQTLVVNLFGQPGAGKSSLCAYIFSQLKMLGVNAEMATEYAKDKCWEESVEVFKNQAYIFGKQYFRLSRVKGKVDVIVTDSPIILSMFYNNQPELDESFDQMCMKVFNSFNNYNVFLTRVKPYNPAGRFQTEEESDALVRPMIDMLQKNGIVFDVYNGDRESADKIVENVMNLLKKN